MKVITIALFFALSTVWGCSSTRTQSVCNTSMSMASIASELIELAEDDQRYEQIVINGEVPEDSEAFFVEKKKMMTKRGDRCNEIFTRIGFPDYEMVGKEASDAFWLIVQHSDYNPEFQSRVSDAMMKPVEDGNADGSNLAYLTDRVRINTGKPQVYGTQVEYVFSEGRAIPKDLEDAQSVDERRKRVGLEPLYVYMNSMSEVFFMMNEKQLVKKGISDPFQYEPGFNQW